LKSCSLVDTDNIYEPMKLGALMEILQR